MKLTPTFNDQAKTGTNPQGTWVLENGGDGPPVAPTFPKTRIEEAHEPLMSGLPLPREEERASLVPLPTEAPGKELKVALVGTAPSSRLLAPYDDPSWQIWACSPGNQGVCKRVDLWFELHGNLLWPECVSYGKPYLDWLNAQPFPIMMQDNSLVKRAIAYPMEEMVRKFGKNFFTSSFSWMMAYAIHCGAKEIALYGIDMASRDEYILQRPGFFYFKERAEERGIRVFAPYESDILQHPGLYGFSEVEPFGRKVLAREQELRARIADARRERDEAMTRLNHTITYLEGALEDVDYFKSIWIGVGHTKL